jgi:hypothetical protein
MSHLARRLFLPSCLALFLTAVGCSDGKPPMNGDVQGVAKFNGAPLVGVVVQFVPDGVSGLLSANATTDAKGHFELFTGDQPGAVVGKHKVIVLVGRGNASRADDPQAAQADNSAPAAASGKAPRLPAWTSDLRQTKITMDVTADKHAGYDFDLGKSG